MHTHQEFTMTKKHKTYTAEFKAEAIKAIEEIKVMFPNSTTTRYFHENLIKLIQEALLRKGQGDQH